jgi:tetratricopeptide (TPR) repeat protein
MKRLIPIEVSISGRALDYHRLKEMGKQWLLLPLRSVKPILRISRNYAKKLRNPKLRVRTAIATLAAIIVGIILFTYVLRVWSPQTIIIVSPFGVPVEKSETLPYSGESLANLLVDEFQKIIRASNSFSGINDYSSSRQFSPLPDTPKIPVQTSFALSIYGISLGELLKIRSYFRYKQESISAEAIRTRPGKVRLTARLLSNAAARSWDLPYEIDDYAVPDHLNALASKVFADLHPATMGRYFLSLHQYGKAEQVFASWASSETDNSDAQYYLGFALTEMGHFEMARMAERRADLLAKHRNHRALGALATIDLDQAELMQSTASRKLYQEAVDYNESAISASCPLWGCWFSKGRYANYTLNEGALFERLGRLESTKSTKMKLFEKAIQAENDSLRIDRRDAGARANIGAHHVLISHAEVDAREQIRHEGQAIAQMWCAISLKPYFPRALKILINELVDLHTKYGNIQERNILLPIGAIFDQPPCSEKVLGNPSGSKSVSSQGKEMGWDPLKQAEEIAHWAALMKPEAEEPMFELGLVLFRESMVLRNEDSLKSHVFEAASDRAFEDALSVNRTPQTGQTLSAQASSLRRLGNRWAPSFMNRAVDIFNRELKEDPRNANLIYSLGEAYYENAEYAEAARQYGLLVDQFPEYDQYAQFQWHMAKALDRADMPDLAVQHFRAAEHLGSLDANGCEFQFWFAHALHHSSSDNLDEVIAMFQNAAQDKKCESPSFAYLYSEYADVLRLRGDTKGALEIDAILTRITAGDQ